MRVRRLAIRACRVCGFSFACDGCCADIGHFPILCEDQEQKENNFGSEESRAESRRRGGADPGMGSDVAGKPLGAHLLVKPRIRGLALRVSRFTCLDQFEGLPCSTP
jgi:hypothetical protein